MHWHSPIHSRKNKFFGFPGEPRSLAVQSVAFQTKHSTTDFYQIKIGLLNVANVTISGSARIDGQYSESSCLESEYVRAAKSLRDVLHNVGLKNAGKCTMVPNKLFICLVQFVIS